jgi:carboxypeptidase C (cathepsin A)
MADPAPPPPPAPTPPPPPPEDRLVRTVHSATVGGRELAYTVSCGTIVLREESETKDGEAAGTSEGDKPRAEVSVIAYTLDGVQDRTDRPVTFAFNGGPGSASVWLHLGCLGPRRTTVRDQVMSGPFRLIDNEHSLLDVSDLVFIDPVSTGYSRAVVGEKAKQFHGFQRDIESVSEVIRLWTTRNRRWTSPKFLAGESYGTTRGTGVAAYMQDRFGLYLNGLMLISCALDFAQLEFDRGNDTPYIGFLPTYAATAWYHGRLAPDLQADLRATVAEVEEFAVTDYAVALARGAKLPDAERSRIIAQLARYTGLSEDYIDRADLRISDQRFFKELLRPERRTVGRIDSRFLGIDRDAAGETPEDDPSIGPVYAPFAATLNDYVRGELEFETDRAYEVLHPTLWKDWSYADHENTYVDVGETLRKTMTANPSLKVFVASGYYDLATPHFTTDAVINRLGLDRTLQDNITTRYYEAGHMMYIHEPSLAALKADLAAFVAGAIPAA